MWLKVLMPKGTFHMFCHLLHSIGLSKYTWLEVQKCTSTEKPGSTQSANTDGRLPGQTRQHLTFCHRAQMLFRPITCAPPFQHCDHMSFLCLSPCPSSLTCPFPLSRSLWSLIPVLHIFKSARQSLHVIGPIMLQPLNMYLMKDSFSPQEFYFLHSDVEKEIMW